MFFFMFQYKSKKLKLMSARESESTLWNFPPEKMFALLHYFCCAVEKVHEKKLCSHTIFPLCTLFLWCTIKKLGKKNCVRTMGR